VKRPLATFAVPLVALGGLGLAACGDDDDDDAPSTTLSAGGTLPDGGTLPGGITVPSLPDVSLPDVSLPDISIPDISIPDISIPDISVDPESLLRQVFPNLDDEQVSCLADALGDISSDFDASQVMNVLGECNIPISDIAPGG
jgi:hypothetical protein